MPVITGGAQKLKPPPEIELLLCCARTYVDDERDRRINALVQGGIQWEKLAQTARSHSLIPLLYWHLNAICPKLVPDAFLRSLQSQFNINAARNLCLRDELCRILKLLESQDVLAIPFKGPVIATSVYRNLALRRFGDLDIFVRRKDVARASEILNLNGYRKEYQLTLAQEAAILILGDELTFTNDKGQVYIDLHWNFVPRYFSLRLELESFWERLERILLGADKVWSFSTEDLFLIICLNGGKELWGRLILLCDIAEMIKVYPNINWHIVMARASAMGLSRILYLSLLLAHDMLEAVIPKEIADKITADTESRILALKIKEGFFEDKVKSQSIRNILKPAKVLSRRRDRIKFYLRLGLTPTIEDWTFITLPRQLFFLYYITRPLRLAKKFLLTAK